ncbi:MAG TPA: papain-like cysteine protease family protein [Candidatus Limnocylindria bacterium]|nr:papain-like cysteine protease family protein [Candidatus Limnocylindria bacterium]
MTQIRRSACLALGVLVVLGGLLVGGQPAAAALTVSMTVPGVPYVSQLTEPSPAGWRTSTTPYCAAASSLAVMSAFGLVPPAANPLQTAFSVGYRGNTLRGEVGLDPAGVSSLMKYYGGEGRVHMYTNKFVALTELVGRLNARVPVVIFGEAGYHAQVVYGYQANAATGEITGVYAQDPLSGFRGLLSANTFMSQYLWWGSPFSSAGNLWRGNYVFVSYREFAGGPAPAAPNTPPVMTYHSAWVAQSAYPTMTVGGTAPIFVQVRNTGTATWVKGTGTEARIGVASDDSSLSQLGIADSWLLSSRPAAQTEAVVAPGQLATFSFSVKGVRLGSYPLRLRPVIDALTWMEDQGIFLQLTVN